MKYPFKLVANFIMKTQSFDEKPPIVEDLNQLREYFLKHPQAQIFLKQEKLPVLNLKNFIYPLVKDKNKYIVLQWLGDLLELVLNGQNFVLIDKTKTWTGKVVKITDLKQLRDYVYQKYKKIIEGGCVYFAKITNPTINGLMYMGIPEKEYKTKEKKAVFEIRAVGLLGDEAEVEYVEKCF